VRAGAETPSPARAGLEQRSRGLLVRLAAVPRLVVLLGALGWLVAVSWPVLSNPQRVLRGLTIVIVVGYAVVRLTT